MVRPARGAIPYDYCVPGGFYEQLWDWDGFFIALHFLCRQPAQPGYMRDWVLNFVTMSDEDGWTPGSVTVEGRRTGIVGFQMKPLLAQGARLAADALDDAGWLAPHYDRLVQVCTRRERTHRDEATGLFAWDDAMQSGADNNPAIGNEEADRGKVLSCDINAFQWLEYRALAGLAARLGRPDQADDFTARADELRARFEATLWCGEDGTYWNVHAGTKAFIRRVSYSNFVPLWAGMATQDQAEQMIRGYLWNEEHMLSPYGLRTLSRQDPEDNNRNIIIPYSNWQGPIWPIANYLHLVALLRYGFNSEAEALAKRVAGLCLADLDAIGSMHENYHAETGATLAPSAEQSKHGREGGFIGWNLLVQDMCEMSLGRHPWSGTMDP